MPPIENKALKRWLARNGLQYIGLVFANLVIFVVMSASYETFLTPYNIEVMLMSFLPEAIMALGMTLVIILGGIDLSVSAVLPTTAIAVGMLLNYGVPTPLAVFLVLCLGTCIGCINAFMINLLKVHPFVVTLAMMLTLKGFNLAITDGATVAGFPESFTYFGQEYWLGIPIPLYIFVFLALVIGYLLQHSTYVRQVYFIGGNEKAARVSGIKVERFRYFVFGLSSFLATVAGLVLAAQYSSANNVFGLNSEMKAITAVAIGGASLYGGSGTIQATMLGTLFLAMINCAFMITGISNYWQDIVNGVMLLIAILITEFIFQRKRK